MQEKGKVISFDKFIGKIENEKGEEFLLLEKDIVEGNLEVNDNVLFTPDIYETPEMKENIARFVRKK